LLSLETRFETPTDCFVRHYSSFVRLKKATAWLLRFFDYLKSRADKASRQSLESMPKTIRVNDLVVAEERLLGYEQRRELPKLVKALEAGKRLTSQNCPRGIQKLDPFLHNGVVRVGGRLQNALVEFNVKHPAILPDQAHVTRLVVTDKHSLVGHGGLSHTFNAATERYWVLRASAVIRKVIDDCFVCRHTGVDCFGPFLVKRGRSVVKRWGCIFTCMTIRAVH